MITMKIMVVSCSVEFYVGFLPEEKLPKLDVERTFLGVSRRKCQSGNGLKKYIPKSKSFEPTLALLFWHLLWEFQKQVRSVLRNAQQLKLGWSLYEFGRVRPSLDEFVRVWTGRKTA